MPVAANLFTTEPELCLIAGRHRDTGKIVFPLPGHASYERVQLPRRGVLWSFTIQRFAPKSPPYRGGIPFLPFALGYVELPGALIVETRLTDTPFESLKVGMLMELTSIDWTDESVDGPRQMYAFRRATDPGDAR